MLANDILLYVSGNLLHFFDPETKDASYLRYNFFQLIN